MTFQPLLSKSCIAGACFLAAAALPSAAAESKRPVYKDDAHKNWLATPAEQDIERYERRMKGDFSGEPELAENTGQDLLRSFQLQAPRLLSGEAHLHPEYAPKICNSLISHINGSDPELSVSIFNELEYSLDEQCLRNEHNAQKLLEALAPLLFGEHDFSSGAAVSVFYSTICPHPDPTQGRIARRGMETVRQHLEKHPDHLYRKGSAPLFFAILAGRLANGEIGPNGREDSFNLLSAYIQDTKISDQYRKDIIKALSYFGRNNPEYAERVEAALAKHSGQQQNSPVVAPPRP